MIIGELILITEGILFSLFLFLTFLCFFIFDFFINSFFLCFLYFLLCLFILIFADFINFILCMIISNLPQQKKIMHDINCIIINAIIINIP